MPHSYAIVNSNGIPLQTDDIEKVGSMNYDYQMGIGTQLKYKGVSLGIDGYRMFSKRWGASLGAHFFWEGFHTSADVKNYYAWLQQEEEVTKGYFTGTNVTNTEMWGQDLTEVPGFEAEAARILKQIRSEGALAAYQACLS